MKRLMLTIAVLLSVTSVLRAETLKVAYNQWAGFTPVFVAQEKGFFEASGVTVELTSFAGPGDSLPPLVAGHLDISLTTPDNAVRLNAVGSDVVCVYMIDTSDGADALVAKKSIATPADLKGKTVAVTVGEVNHLLLLKALESAGLSEGDINIVNMNPDDAGAAFIGGSVDAAVTWEPWVSKASTEGDGHVIFSSKDAPNILLDVVAVTRDTLDTKTAALKAFVAGLEKGVQFLKSNPDEAHALAGKWLDVSGEDVAGMLDGVKSYTMEDNKVIFAQRSPLVDPLKAISAFLKSKGAVETEPDVEKMVDGTLLGN